MDHYLTEVFTGTLEKLKEEITKFKDENNIWRTIDGVTNPAGTLVLHLLGNLQFTIGTQIGHTGYVRNREEEFSQKGVSRDKLIATIDHTIEVVKTSLANFNSDKMEKAYPLEMLGKHNYGWYLSYFYGHFNYHLGQVNYLRRILEAGL